MSEVVIRCYRKKEGERRANFDAYFLFELTSWGDCWSSEFDISESQDVTLNITCEYQSGSRLYGLWVREAGLVKLSVQGVKSTDRNDDPVVCYSNGRGELYTFLIMFKNNLVRQDAV